MSVIGWILFGLAVGVVGKLLMPGRDPGGFILTILLGVGGALVGGFSRTITWVLPTRGTGGFHHGCRRVRYPTPHLSNARW
jgi:uncharacterized membrane protein YeaQ/YmgE (transglycosylase-associated protein family)